MSAFRRVDARQAGPEALGILVPPGQRTVVILRPRPLEWDLLPLAAGKEHFLPAVFANFERDTAAVAARRVQKALETSAGGEANPLEVVCSRAGAAYGVCARLDSTLWIVCRRAAGRGYQPAFFETVAAAEAVVKQLTPFLWPAAQLPCEYYFNTQSFTPQR